MEFKKVYTNEEVHEMFILRFEFGFTGAEIKECLLRKNGKSPAISHIFSLTDELKKKHADINPWA